MAVSLSKGGNVSLTKEAGPAGLFRVQVGLGWDVRTTTGVDFDLDASALMLTPTGKVASDQHFVFYGNLSPPTARSSTPATTCTGEGEGDDEVDQRRPRRGAADDRARRLPGLDLRRRRPRPELRPGHNAFIRVVNADDEQELTRYDLSEDASSETAMVFGELYRRDAEWKFRAVGQGYASGLAGIARDYGVNVG